jgi:hypothetical protein
MFGWRQVAIATILGVASSMLPAKPFAPADDALVLERLPERSDPALAQLKRMRGALAREPGDLELAVAVARRSIEASRTLGDPRYLGQAQAALSRWWTGYDIPPATWLLRATLKQSQHDFNGSLADLDRLLAAYFGNTQALLTRATVLAVLGRYADARRDCAQLASRVAPIIVAGCSATPASLSGHAGAAYDTLTRELARAEQIEVGDEEIHAEIDRMAPAGSENEQAAQLRQVLETQSGHALVYRDLVTEKTLVRLREIATGKAPELPAKADAVSAEQVPSESAAPASVEDQEPAPSPSDKPADAADEVTTWESGSAVADASTVTEGAAEDTPPTE